MSEYCWNYKRKQKLIEMEMEGGCSWPGVAQASVAAGDDGSAPGRR